MTHAPTRVLIIDDQLLDAGVITAAVEVCFSVFGSKASIKVMRGPVEAETVAGENAQLVISDLFMTEQKFDDLSVLEQCNEMETPYGLKLLKKLGHRPGTARLATTFFWNYPGFDRYKTALFNELDVDGVIPKDIFYLCASLRDGVSLKDVELFPPLRILVQALHSVLWPPSQGGGKIAADQMSRFLLRSLFAEASAWLSSYPHHVLDVRNGMEIHDSTAGKNDLYHSWEEASDIAQYSTAGPWMPCFTLVSGTAMAATETGFYMAQMQELAEKDNWRVHVQIPSHLAIVPETERRDRRYTDVDWDGEVRKIKYPPRQIGPVDIKNLLRPRGGDDRHWAQLLLTLGMFSYWCHLPDHRAVRTAEEIAELIREKAGKPYRGIIGDSDAADSIADDLEMLHLFLLRRIKMEKHNHWWRYMQRHGQGVAIIGADKRKTKGKKGDGTGYWLNASFRIDTSK